jgi:hypothetical protein
MELLPDDFKGLRDIWSDPVSRQKAKLVIASAVTQATSITVKEQRDILDALDQILEEEQETQKPKADPAL